MIQCNVVTSRACVDFERVEQDPNVLDYGANPRKYRPVLVVKDNANVSVIPFKEVHSHDKTGELSCSILEDNHKCRIGSVVC